ncbi:hypothetical protein EJ08DRAFT_700958 [Tothia fuscella]|uniref:Extracellular serine-rich protein n=1 Tax=Tothia fuscella TaxID=1048955 RepID=A0A9P4NJL8_9PEZI|nr:hypothetical protein EJ08DRAFT_700958 [Tothia fuscella]
MALSATCALYALLNIKSPLCPGTTTISASSPTSSSSSRISSSSSASVISLIIRQASSSTSSATVSSPSAPVSSSSLSLSGLSSLLSSISSSQSTVIVTPTLVSPSKPSLSASKSSRTSKSSSTSKSFSTSKPSSTPIVSKQSTGFRNTVISTRTSFSSKQSTIPSNTYLSSSSALGIPASSKTSTSATLSSILSSFRSISNTPLASTTTSITIYSVLSASSNTIFVSLSSQQSSRSSEASSSSSSASITSSSAPASSSLGIFSDSSSILASSSIALTASSTSSVIPSASASPNTGPVTVDSTILVFARDTASSYSATSGLNGHGIPYQLVIVPSAGTTLPTLNSSLTDGNYGGIIVLGEVSYQYSAGFASALTPEQWQTLYAYQIAFGVRMARLDVYPGSDFGTTTAIPGAGCCDIGVEQPVSFTNTSAFPTAGYVQGATMSTQGLWHYPATITDSSTTWEVASFGAGGLFSSRSTAAVINNFGGRQQIAWFTSFANDWSTTSNFLQHSYIHFVTRGLFAGRRRIFFGTQIDDMHLETELYFPVGGNFRLRPADLDAHVAWTKDINGRLPAGSNFFVEIGHNGNGDIQAAVSIDNPASCSPETGIEFDELPATPLEFQKAVGTGANIWPKAPASYIWSLACAKYDPLASWFMIPANRDAFAHVSHTFAHMSQNNATYSDANREIFYNIAWMKQVGIWDAARFSSGGLIPPAITGLHNGDAIKAWMDNGIKHVVGDNTRPPLRNQENEFWPVVSSVANNGYAGLTIVPRWATTIFYNCDTAACTTAEWVTTSGGKGDFAALLKDGLTTNTRHLLGLHHDPFMFHQANMRQTDVESFTVGNQSGKMSLLQVWTETIAQEMSRITTWPLITIKHDDIATEFLNRMTRDKCVPSLKWTVAAEGQSIIDATVGASGNSCGTPIPVTFPVDAVTTAGGTTSEKVGSDPVVKWNTLSGSAVSWKFASPIAV